MRGDPEDGVLETKALEHLNVGNHRFWSEKRRTWVAAYHNQSEASSDKYVVCSCGWEHREHTSWKDDVEDDVAILTHRLEALIEVVRSGKATADV